MKLLTFPLAVLIVISLLSMTGLGSTALSAVGIPLTSPSDITYYDSSGAAVCSGNGSALNADDGRLTHILGSYYGQDYAGWYNSSGTYHLYYDNTGSVAMYVLYNDFGKMYNDTAAASSFDLTSGYGLIGLVVGIMALAAVVGLRVLGTGTSEESVSAIIKGTALLALWGIFSVLSLELITAAGDLFLPIIYFILTGVYTLGIINQIGHPGDD